MKLSYCMKLAAVAVILATTACASTDASDAALAGDPQAMWAEGQKTVVKGEQMVAKGDKQLTEGRNKVREGENLIDAGNERMLQARQDYQSAASAVGASTTPDQVASEGKKLKDIGSRWEDAIDDVKTGNKMVTKGNKMISDGQLAVAEGRRMIESGSTMMRNSQRSQIGEELLESVKAN